MIGAVERHIQHEAVLHFCVPIIVVRDVFWLPVVTNTYVTSCVIVILNIYKRRRHNMLSITGEHAVTNFLCNE